MAQVVVGVVFKANSSSGRPLGVLLCRSLLRQAGQLDLLTFSQLADQRPLPFRIRDDRVADGIVHALAHNDQITRINRHDPTATTRVQGKRHAAAHTVVLTITVARVYEVLVAVFRVERDHTQTVREHLIRDDGGIAFNLNEIKRDGGDIGEDGTTKGVGQRQVDRAETKIETVGLRLVKSVSTAPQLHRDSWNSLRGR